MFIETLSDARDYVQVNSNNRNHQTLFYRLLKNYFSITMNMLYFLRNSKQAIGLPQIKEMLSYPINLSSR